ncbi:MAG: GNAT family N-acetyltransferase [Dictyoglomus sp. NZ13-RE01]|nr:MAG: GNAT family N-acetyltransferase [Dictyoglomus sp. NZ13-RE01]
MIRKAKIKDVPEIQKLINEFAEKGLLLPRSLSDLYENIRDFYVVDIDGIIVGCCALHVIWEDLGEVRSLIVREEFRGNRFGERLVKTCLKEAEFLGLRRVLSLTYIPEYFEKLGFERIDKKSLPYKVWTDCVKCPKFPDCGEIALLYYL